MRRVLFGMVLVTAFSATVAAADVEGARRTNIEEVFRHIYARNPELQSEKKRLEETRELLPQARAGWRPRVDAEAGVYASDIRGSNFGGGRGTTTKEVSLTLNQPVYNGGSTEATTARARALIAAGEAAFESAAQALFLQAATAYADVIRDRELANLDMDNEEILEKELEAAGERFRLGDITATDVRQAEARLARARAARAQSEGRLGESDAVFTAIAGFAPPPELVVPEPRFAFPRTVEDMVTQAQDANPEARRAALAEEASDHETESVEGELWPQVSAYASYNKQFDPQPGIIDTSETRTVGVKATMALYEAGLVRSRLREAEIRTHRRAADAEDTQRVIRREVARNWQAHVAAGTEGALRQAEIRAKTAARDGIREEARMGQRTVLDILDAQQELIDAQRAQARATREELVTAYALAASLGLLTPGELGLAGGH